METRLTLRGGEIRGSLFGAADDVGLPDAITLALLAIAIVPWLAPIFKSLEFPGGLKVEFQELQKAAQRALQRGSSDVAVSMLRRALAEPPTAETYGEVVRALGLAQRLLDNPEAIRLLTEAFDLVTEPEGRARIGIELGRCLIRANRPQEAIDAFRRARDALAGADPDLDESIWSEVINLGWFYLAFGAFVIVGAANAVNFTDGLDGLATVPVMIASAAFGFIAYLVGNYVFANYLQIHFVPGVGEVALGG